MLVPATDALPFRGMPCLVWAYGFDTEGSGRALDVTALDDDRLQQARQEHAWLWLHFDTSDARTPQAIARLGLSEEITEALLSHDTHVSLQMEDATAFGVFVDWRHQRGVDIGKHSFARSEKEVGWLHFAVGADVLVTARRQALRSVEQVHQHVRGADPTAYFAAFEEIVAAHAGRPHWGKLHTLDAERLSALYPRHGDFVALRRRLDPDRVLTNDYLDRVLGP